MVVDNNPLHNRVLELFMTYYWVCNKSNTTGDISGTGPTYPPIRLRFLSGIRVARSFVLCVVFC